MPGFAFPTAGPLGLGSPPSRLFLSFSHRYYARLRLPFLLLRSLRLRLASRYLVLSRLGSCPLSGSLAGCEVVPISAWPCSLPACLTGCHHKEMTVLSSSRATPVCTCPARRSRWCPLRSPLRVKDHSLPARRNRRLCRACARLSSWTTTINFSGLGHAACTLATPGFIHTLTAMHAGSLKTRWLTSSHGNWTEVLTHWVTSSNFTASGPIPRIWV